MYRVLSTHYRPIPGGTGPSWVSFIGHTTDSLWSVDLFRCESIVLRSDWVLVVMDQFTRRLVGVGVAPRSGQWRRPLPPVQRRHAWAVCAPRHLSTDHDPLFEAHRWTANLRILEIDEIKTVPHVPRSHPFVERLIGTTRREFLDPVLFWHARDLERTLGDFQASDNEVRSHASLKGHTVARAELNNVRWISHCHRVLRPATSGGLTTNSRRTGDAPDGSSSATRSRAAGRNWGARGFGISTGGRPLQASAGRMTCGVLPDTGTLQAFGIWPRQRLTMKDRR